MNQELKDMTQEKLTQYLEVLENSVTTGAELAQQEIPLLAQEILNWEFYSHLIIGLSLLLVSFLISLVVRLIYKHYKNISHNGGSEEEVAMFLLGFSSALAAGFGGFQLTLALKVVVAPRLVLLEYIGGLIG